MRRRFVRRNAPKKQNVQWSDISGQFTLSAVGSTSTAILVQLQSPASLAALTSDPPEDLTVLRVKGFFSVTLSAAASAAQWDLALLVQDTTWTPSATITTDNDKRMLWTRTFAAGTTNAIHTWREPGYLEIAATAFVDQRGMVEVDIAPKVRIEAGKALFLVAYESVTGRDLTVNSSNMRLLYKRSGRR